MFDSSPVCVPRFAIVLTQLPRLEYGVRMWMAPRLIFVDEVNLERLQPE